VVIERFACGCPIGDRSPDCFAGDRDHSEISTNGVSYKWYGNNCKRGALYVHSPYENTLIGYARCSTDKQDLIYTDHGQTGTNRARPGLDQAIAAVREGDTLVVPKLDRLARSVPGARTIADQLAAKGVKLALGASIYDPTDPMGKMFFNILATFAEFESDLIRMRTREGMAIARAKGKLRGKQPKLSEKQQKELGRMHGTGE
jgi:DNA invertase Pin-like site-specific DNA recombinase